MGSMTLADSNDQNNQGTNAVQDCKKMQEQLKATVAELATACHNVGETAEYCARWIKDLYRETKPMCVRKYESLKKNIKNSLGDIKTEVQVTKDAVKTVKNDVKEIKTDMKDLVKDVVTEFDSMQGEVKSAVKDLKEELESITTEVGQEVDSVQGAVKNEVKDLKQGINTMKNELRSNVYSNVEEEKASDKEGNGSQGAKDRLMNIVN